MFEQNSILLLKVTKNALFFDPLHSLPVSKIALKLAEINEIEFFNESFHWLKVKLKKYESGILLFEIIDFYPFEKRVFNSQNFDLSSVRQVLFYSADTFKILKLAKRKAQTKKSAPNGGKIFRPVAAFKQKIKKSTAFTTKPQISTPSSEPKPTPMPSVKAPSPKPNPIKKTIHFFVPFAKLKFHNGYVTLLHYVLISGLPHGLMIAAKIKNDFIKEGFEFIKDYFRNLLKINAVHVKADVLIKDGEVTVLKAVSPEIERITPDLIGEVKVRYIKKELHRISGKDEILTVNQLLSAKSKGEKVVFNVHDEEFIRDLIRIKKPKHGEHIKYLVGLHNYRVLKLRVITNPLSFLFFLQGEKQYFLAWETLFGADGTYIWTLPQSPDTLLQNKTALKRELIRIENEIKKIKAIGRLEYLKNKPTNFTRIFHNYRDAKGFEIWKEEVRSLLKA